MTERYATGGNVKERLGTQGQSAAPVPQSDRSRLGDALFGFGFYASLLITTFLVISQGTHQPVDPVVFFTLLGSLPATIAAAVIGLLMK